ncbi:MAG TPA: flavodoxin domain-containing protein [Fimbriimonadaceae bacterium]|nr:flavodoxin domain-containing protein [Fimbriimonadaceae bacterium]
MKRVAIVYFSKYGQTAKIAERLRVALAAHGAQATTYQIAGRSDYAGIDLEAADGVVVGGPVFAGKLPKPLREWALRNTAKLNSRPLGVFTVSLNAADARPQAREGDRTVLHAFCDATQLYPKLSASFKGALSYSKYGPFMRWMMKRISASASGPTDTGQDYEMTDWAEVDAFAPEFVQLLIKPKSEPERSKLSA